MADLILTWHIPGQLSETGVKETNTSTEYTLDQDYMPGRVIMRLKEAGEDSSGGACTIDINDDGISIFDNNPSLISNATKFTYSAFKSNLYRLEKDSVITLDIDDICSEISGADLTIQLELNKA